MLTDFLLNLLASFAYDLLKVLPSRFQCQREDLLCDLRGLRNSSIRISPTTACPYSFIRSLFVDGSPRIKEPPIDPHLPAQLAHSLPPTCSKASNSPGRMRPENPAKRPARGDVSITSTSASRRSPARRVYCKESR